MFKSSYYKTSIVYLFLCGGKRECVISIHIIFRLYLLVFTSLAWWFVQEKCVKEIVLKAMGQAISKSVAVTEILKVISLALLDVALILSSSVLLFFFFFPSPLL